MSHTPIDSHFVSNPELDLLSHRPHKSAIILFNAVLATAVFRIWPTLLFMGGWSTMIVLVNMKTSAEMTVPTTMLTVLGVLLGLTLSYRTSSAYDRYWEGRRMWSQIILACRTWSRMVWIHCPDSTSVTPPTDPAELELDTTRGVLEKKTMVQMALAFSVAVKHYLRGEEGILYEDLYDLVNFIPSLDLPSGIASSEDANNPSIHHPSRLIHHSVTAPVSVEGSIKDDRSAAFGVPTTPSHRPILAPARSPPKFRWAETFPFRFFQTDRQKLKAAGRKALKERMKAERAGGGVGQNIPLEITMFMSSWIAMMQARKTVDVPTINTLLAALQSMADALSSLERILTTPIPWSYDFHIWAITYIYCLLLPFQLYGGGFGWTTIPAVVITSYIVVGFAAIGEEIENPFGYDKNDLNLDFFVESIIKQELAAITARPFPPPHDWVFTGNNKICGLDTVGADKLQHCPISHIRARLAALSSGGEPDIGKRSRTPAGA